MTWHLHLDILLMVLILAVAYWVGVEWAGGAARRRPTRGQVGCYFGGVAVLWIGAGSPLHDLGETYLYSAHMLQHILFSMVAAPLMLLGTPGWMLEPLLRGPRAQHVAQVITRPTFALGAYSVVLVATHLPDVVNTSLRIHQLHFVLHVALVASSLLLWWPVFGPPIKAAPRVNPLAQMLYLFVQSLIPTVIAAFITFANQPVYEFYTLAPERMWGISVVEDQRIAGLLMKLGGAAILYGMITVIFFQWFNHAGRSETPVAPAALRWDEVEAELRQMGLTKP